MEVDTRSRAELLAEIEELRRRLREADGSLRHSKLGAADAELLETVVNHLPAAVALIRGSDLRLKLVNRAYQEIAPGKEMVGKTLDELWPETGQEFGPLCRRVLETGEPHLAQDELNRIRRTPDGPVEDAYFSWSMLRVRLPGSGGWGLINVAWETTDRKKAENDLLQALFKAAEGNRMLTALMEHVPEGITIADADLHLRMVSRHGQVLLGAPHADKSIEEVAAEWTIFHPDGTTLMTFDELPLVRAIRRGETVRDVELVQVNADGVQLPILCNAGPMRDSSGAIVGGIVTWRDISEAKRAAQELSQAHADLERRVEERTDALARTIDSLQREYAERIQAMEELREKDQLLIQQSRLAAMGEMVNNIAHQWRQPLNVVGLQLQRLLLVFDSGELDRDFLEKSISGAMNQIRHMSQTIEDFRNFFKPNKETTTFSVDEAIVKTVSLVRDGFAINHVRLVTELGHPRKITGFFNEFCQAILNLLQNAREAIRERKVKDGIVTVTSASSDGRALIVIRDNGGGVPEEILPRIFDPYFSTKGRQGTGIGLYMSRSIVETMGGTIGVRNTPEGAEFTIEV